MIVIRNIDNPIDELGGADTLGGQGVASAIGDSGPDVYGFIKGNAGGAGTIEGCKPVDTLVFAGYGAAAIIAEAVINGSDVSTLNASALLHLGSLQAIEPFLANVL